MQLSVIVPVYNVEKYLDDCLLSLSKQGFIKGEHEVIVVNDGSTDGSEKIIDEFCQRFDYFIKVNKPNGGVSSARNLGLEVATGEFVTFVDSDDMVAENALQCMLEICQKQDLDGFYYGWQFAINGEPLDKICSAKDIEYEVCESVFTVTARLNVYKKKLLDDNGIIFDTQMRFAEDALFARYFSSVTKRVGNTEQKIYYYRKNDESVFGRLMKNNEFATVKGDGYVCFLCQLKLTKRVALLTQNTLEGEKEKQSLSALLYDFLYQCLKAKRKAGETIKDLKKYEVKLSDLSKETFKGQTFKQKIKGFVLYSIFRCSLLYRLACFAYRMLKKG